MSASKNEQSDSETWSEFVFVNGVPTYVLKYGASDLVSSDCDSLILVIPGKLKSVIML